MVASCDTNANGNYFVKGAITGDEMEKIKKSHSGTHSGAVCTFQGIVRADSTERGIVKGIDYSAYESMAIKEFSALRDDIIRRYSLNALEIRHSLGYVAAGECSLFIFCAARHRREAFEGTSETVESIKKMVPIWKEEIYSDRTKRTKTSDESLMEVNHERYNSKD